MRFKVLTRALIWGLVLGGLAAVFVDIFSYPVPTPAEQRKFQAEVVEIVTPQENDNPLAVSMMQEEPPSLDARPLAESDTVPGPKLPGADEPINREPEGIQTGTAPKVAFMLPREVIPAPKLNRSTDNLNVLFVGVNGQQLEMTALYSINEAAGYRSGAVFFPVDTFFQGRPLSEIYRREGVNKIKQVLQEELEVEIAYYVRMDRHILLEVETFIEPIVVDGREVDLTNLFTMEVTPNDEEILGKLMQQLTRPNVYFFHLPKLVFAFQKYMDTDFRPTLDNLKTHFQVARRIKADEITKVIVGRRQKVVNGQKIWEVPDSILKNVVYQITI